MNFYLPDFCDPFNLNRIIVELWEKEPEKFYDGVEIKAVYGSFYGAIWNGGRLKPGISDRERIKSSLAYFNEKGIPCRFTWTNSLLEEKHLNDTYCNLIMNEGNNGLNEAIVNMKLLEDYIREAYPKYKIISSTTKCILDIDEFNEELKKDYKLVVLDYRNNNNYEFLEKIEDKGRVEIVLNEICSPDCKVRKEHFDYHSKMQLNYETLNSYDWECNDGSEGFYKSFKNRSFVKLEDLQRLKEMGFKHFKIQGRYGNPAEVLENYVYYMIKPEYRDEVRLDTIMQIWNP